MDLPTYTNIWRIEKRLYKLYDLRLPMPLPIVWIGVFVGVFVPWSLLLVLVGVPVQMPWHVLFLVPPGIVTWLSTRPVIEGKRLTELLESQLRYLGQPKAWYRMAPSAEPETVVFSGRVWRTGPARAKSKAPRKARQPQRRREAQRLTGPRQVRPAVAAAAAAAAQAPVAEPSSRTGWGTRRGTAPALKGRVWQETASPAPGAPAGAGWREEGLSGGAGGRQERPVSLLDEAVGANRGDRPQAPAEPGFVGTEPESGERSPVGAGEAFRTDAGPKAARADVASEAARADAASEAAAADDERDGEARDAVRARPATEPDAVPGDAHVETSAEAVAAREASVPIRTAESRKPAAGKPIDTEALRRLRRLAASADAPAAADAGRGESGVRRGAEERGEDEVARDQHRKGQPPRLSQGLLPGTQRVWPPLNPNAKPVPRPAAHEPAAGAGDDERLTQAQHAAPETPAEAQAAAEVPGVVHEHGAPAVGEHEGDELSAGEREVASAREATAPGDGPGREVASARDTAARSDGAGQEAPDAHGAATPGEDVVQKPTPEPPTLPQDLPTPVPVPRPGEGKVRRIESVVGRDSGGWRRIAQVVVGGGGVRTDGSEIDEARARAVFGGGRRIVVLGCTGGAGQTTTALMLGHTLAQVRDDRIVAVDANTGGGTLTSKIEPETPETLTSLLSGLDRVSGYLTMRGYTTRTSSGLEVISADTDAGAEQRLADRSFFSDYRLGESMRLLDRHYKLAVIDPAAALAARLLPYADQLVLVVPASEEAPEAVAMTYEWLDGHGCAELRRRAVMVVNGVSRRSMTDVEQAESVARGRCRAIVRVPWEDDLAPGGAGMVDPGQLRATGRRAYLALAGVVVAGFAAQTVRAASEEELASDPPGTRIGER